MYLHLQCNELTFGLFTGGSLIDCMGTQFEPETVLKVFYQACQAVKHLHSQSMPITHRDIKVIVVCPIDIKFWIYTTTTQRKKKVV